MPGFKIFKCAKIVRVIRIKAVIAKLNVPANIKAGINLVKLVFYLYLWIHIISCIWYFTILSNKDEFLAPGVSARWYPPSDWVNYLDSDLHESKMLNKYLKLLYYSILVIGNNEMGPVNPNEMFVMTILILLSSILNSIVFGEIAMIVHSL